MTSDQKLAKLETLLKMVDESITKEDFVHSFEAVLKYVKGIKDKNDVIITRIEDDFTKLSEKLEKLGVQEVEKAKQSVLDMCDPLMDKMKREHKAGMDKVDEKLGMMDEKMAAIRNGEPGKPGKDADGEKIRKQLLKELRDELKTEYKKLFGEIEDRLNAKIKAIPERPTTQIFGPGKTRIIKVDLSSQLDGSTKTFNIGFSHFGIISVQSDSAPFGAFREVVDYNEVGRTIVFTDAIDASISLAAGHSLILKVLK